MIMYGVCVPPVMTLARWIRAASCTMRRRPLKTLTEVCKRGARTGEAGASEDKAVATRAKDKHHVLDQPATMEKEATKQRDDFGEDERPPQITDWLARPSYIIDETYGSGICADSGRTGRRETGMRGATGGMDAAPSSTDPSSPRASPTKCTALRVSTRTLRTQTSLVRISCISSCTDGNVPGSVLLPRYPGLCQ